MSLRHGTAMAEGITESDCLNKDLAVRSRDMGTAERVLPCGNDAVGEFVLNLLFNGTAQIAGAKLDGERVLYQVIDKGIVPSQADIVLGQRIAQLPRCRGNLPW